MAASFAVFSSDKVVRSKGTGSEIPRKPGSMLGACVRVTNVGSEEFDEVHRRALASGRAERG